VRGAAKLAKAKGLANMETARADAERCRSRMRASISSRAASPRTIP
jgi:hypothetical protein